jgi:hypothetical protein
MTTFGRMNDDGSIRDVRQIRQADILACPFAILVADHYYPDGRCKCGDPTERARMIREWGYSEEDFADIPVRIDPAYVEWCRQHFASIREGGIWAIPRSGLIFTKRAGRLVLTAAMPWNPAMEGTITAEELRAQQYEEFEGNRQHFAAAGIEVIRAEEVSSEPT